MRISFASSTAKEDTDLAVLGVLTSASSSTTKPLPLLRAGCGGERVWEFASLGAVSATEDGPAEVGNAVVEDRSGGRGNPRWFSDMIVAVENRLASELSFALALLCLGSRLSSSLASSSSASRSGLIDGSVVKETWRITAGSPILDAVDSDEAGVIVEDEGVVAMVSDDIGGLDSSVCSSVTRKAPTT